MIFSTTVWVRIFFLWQCYYVLLVPIPVYLLSVLISLPASIRSLTRDHVIIQLTQHQITSGSAWQLPIHISLRFLRCGIQYNWYLFFLKVDLLFSSLFLFFKTVMFKNKYTHVAGQVWYEWRSVEYFDCSVSTTKGEVECWPWP